MQSVKAEIISSGIFPLNSQAIVLSKCRPKPKRLPLIFDSHSISMTAYCTKSEKIIVTKALFQRYIFLQYKCLVGNTGHDPKKQVYVILKILKGKPPFISLTVLAWFGKGNLFLKYPIYNLQRGKFQVVFFSKVAVMAKKVGLNLCCVDTWPNFHKLAPRD